MNSFNYISSNHSSDLEIIQSRIEYYLDKSDFEITLDTSSVHIVFESELTKDDLFKLDVTMSSLGYVRP